MLLLWSCIVGKVAAYIKNHAQSFLSDVFYRGVVEMQETLVQTSKIVELLECNLETKSLLAGTLLKWMDIIACLAGMC